MQGRKLLGSLALICKVFLKGQFSNTFLVQNRKFKYKYDII